MQRRITGGQIKIAGHGRHVPILVQDERERGARRPLTYALPSGVSRRVSNSGNKGAYGPTHKISIPHFRARIDLLRARLDHRRMQHSGLE